MAALLVYNLLLVLLFPFLLIYLGWRLLKGKEDLARWGERWGRFPVRVASNPGRPRFWVHAVSVGEVMAAAPILRELRRRFPQALIVVSTITPSGREVALKQIPPADEVVYFPLDLPGVVDSALRRVRPDAVLLMEWEIWPNFLARAKKRGARIMVLNGRVSDRGLARGTRGAFFTRPGLQAVDQFAMQSNEDAHRAALVGAKRGKIVTLGNTKFDESATALTPAERARLRHDLGLPGDVPVWVCGSTRPGEEMILAAAFAQARRVLPSLCLIVAPRHLERASEVAAVFGAAGFSVRRRSEASVLPPNPPSLGGEDSAGRTASDGQTNEPRRTHSSPPPRLGGPGGEGESGAENDVLLLDTFGELARVYAVADVAFVGGSLKPFGGQSVFQPLAQGVPALFGPYMNNQRDIAALARADGVGFEVTNADDLAQEVVRCVSLIEPEKRALAARARALVARNQGVAARCVDALARLLEGNA